MIINYAKSPHNIRSKFHFILAIGAFQWFIIDIDALHKNLIPNIWLIYLINNNAEFDFDESFFSLETVFWLQFFFLSCPTIKNKK